MESFQWQRQFVASVLWASIVLLGVNASCAADTPDLVKVQQAVAKKLPKVHVLGLHKERDGAYLVITDTNADNFGGPYSLLKLESGQWAIQIGHPMFNGFEIMK